MARREVAAILRSAGMPVVYQRWPDGSAPSFPCVRYVSEGRADFIADARNYAKVGQWSATLVSERKDDAAEAALEAALEAAHVVYAKSGDYYDDAERLNHVEYTFSLPE